MKGRPCRKKSGINYQTVRTKELEIGAARHVSRPVYVRAQKLKTQRRNIAGGEKGAKCRRLRSFDLIHNFAVFRGETGLVPLRPVPLLFRSPAE